MTNKEKFLTLVSKEKTNTIEKNKERIRNRAMLRESQKIAIKVLGKLDEMGWTQKKLAAEMEVSPQQISKIVSGKENLTIDTQIKLQNILDIPILASFYEKKINELQEKIFSVEKKLAYLDVKPNMTSANYQSSRTLKMNCSYTTENFHPKAV